MTGSGEDMPSSATTKKVREYVRTPESIRRGSLLGKWLEKHDYDSAEFARDAKISKMTMTLYLRGDLDVANMHQRTVEKLLTAMHVSDSWAWDYFEIPSARRTYWRTFREAPMGHGEETPQEQVTITLDMPMSGEGYAAPVGAKVTYDPQNVMHGLLLSKLAGRYVLSLIDALPQQGQVLGQFISCVPASPESGHSPAAAPLAP
ncbi:hypothetical protein ACFSR9_11880 [Deinococcus taklimakanensis]|uniref:DUF2867 domain-containing protein n=1 Tax=Deinococcus taklimakanensis TaxID=536443 RepID=A0ABW5P4H0_9DEIO